MLKNRLAELRGRTFREDPMRPGVARRADLNMMDGSAAKLDGSVNVILDKGKVRGWHLSLGRGSVVFVSIMIFLGPAADESEAT